MIDLIDLKRKTIYRFTTDIQGAVEYFAHNILNDPMRGGTHLSLPTDTGEDYPNYPLTIVKVKVTKKDYKFELGTHIQRELS